MTEKPLKASCPACEYLNDAKGATYILRSSPNSCQIMSAHEKKDGVNISRTFWVLRKALDEYDNSVEGTCDSHKFVALQYIGGSEEDTMYKLMIYETKPIETPNVEELEASE